MSRRLVVALLFIFVSVPPWGVQEAVAQTQTVASAEPLVTPIPDAMATAWTIQFAEIDQSGAGVPRGIRRQATRSWTTPLVVALQATTVATQALDVHSTMKAVERGAVEANPLMSGIVKNKAAFIGVKAAMGAGFMYATHRMAKRNKVGAIVTAAAVNSVYLFVAHHNYKVARALR